MTRLFKVLICGGRNYQDREKVFRYLDDIDAVQRIDVVIDGHCRVWDADSRTYVDSGADRWANEWCIARGRTPSRHPADWNLGRAAGPIRNKYMLTLDPNVVVAFPGGAGTASTVEQARRRNIEVIEVA